MFSVASQGFHMDQIVPDLLVISWQLVYQGYADED